MVTESIAGRVGDAAATLGAGETTETVVPFIRTTRCENLPGDVVVQAKRSSMDFLAVAFAAWTVRASTGLAGLLESYGAVPQAGGMAVDRSADGPMRGVSLTGGRRA